MDQLEVKRFQVNTIEDFINSLGKPSLFSCFQKLDLQKKEEFIAKISVFVESELNENCNGKTDMEELKDTNSV